MQTTLGSRWMLWLVAGAALQMAATSARAGLDGIMIYEMRCVACHDKPQDRTPSREVLEKRSPEDIIRALKSGAMQAQAAGLSDEQIRDVALFLTQKDLGTGALVPEPNRCANPATTRKGAAEWNGWGPDVHNSRFQPSPGLTAAEVPRLKLKWAFGYRGTITYGQPTLAGGQLFVTSANGRVYALDPASGCVHWTVDVPAGVRTAVSVGSIGRGSKARAVAYFGDEQANLYAVDAATGERLWQQKLETHPSARITGAPALYRGRLYVPLSSAEEGVGRATNYACCTFRGSVAAVDAATGKLIWRGYTIADEAKPYRKNSEGLQLYGPAGVAIWSTPAIDARRKLVYVATGNSYTDVAVGTSNAVIAFDLDTGRMKWANQVTAGDNYLVMCMQPGVANCPQQLGPDIDFGAPPILRTIADGSRHGRQVLLAGQKSGVVHAFDPDAGGKLLWSVKVGRGGPGGGVEWGPAADDRAIYVAISDELPIPGNVAGGLTALEIATGRKLWFAPPPPAVCGWGPRNCTPAQSAAISAMPGVVFSGAMDGHLRAFATDDGRILWDYDSGQAYTTVNGVPASGGSFDGGGPAIAGGMLFVNSGYGKFAGQPGNVLLAFSVDGK